MPNRKRGAPHALTTSVFSASNQELASLPLWKSTSNGDFIVRSFVAKNFVSAMAFLNEVATVAEEQGHHPDLHLTQYRNVELRLQTHSMGGEGHECVGGERYLGPVVYLRHEEQLCFPFGFRYSAPDLERMMYQQHSVPLVLR